MNDKIKKLKEEVVKASLNPNFIHYKWFAKYHLDIVYDISMELAGMHSECSKDLVEVIVWLHDYGKILDFDNQEEVLFTKGRELMKRIGFESSFVEKTIEYLKIFESKMELDLNKAPMEVKIVSSADAASHFFGPFFYLWWYENPEKDFEELMKDNIRKANKDWERKIVIPEVKELIINRYQYLLEQAGRLPSNYFSG